MDHCYENESSNDMSTFYSYYQLFRFSGLVFESLQVVGVCLFAFRVLPKMQSILHGLALMTGVAFVPSVSKVGT